MVYQAADHAHAVVIGGSIAGLLAARVLADRFQHVTLVDRDRLPLTAQARRGVPQSVQPHVLFTKGYRILEQLFPGIGTALSDAGAIAFDWGTEFRHYQAGHWAQILADAPGLKSYTCTRPLLESTIRQRVQQLPNVQLLTEHRVIGLSCDSAHSRITGVKLDRRSTQAPDELLSQLVVDASGRSTQAPHWLTNIGFTSPMSTVIDPGLGYATRRYRLPPHATPDCKILLISHEPPDQTRLGYLAQVEKGEWIVTLGGYGHDYPPTHTAGFVEFAHSLPSQEIYQVIVAGELVADTQVHRATANRLYHYEQTELPAGFVAMGDAVCALCPVYGQGMTVSALAAIVLQEWLTQPQQTSNRSAFQGAKFQQQLARSNALPWSLATGLDGQFPTTKGAKSPSRLERVFQQYTKRLMLRAHTDPELQLQFLKVAQMLESPAKLLHPRTLLKALL